MTGWSVDFVESGQLDRLELSGRLEFDIDDWFPGADVTPEAAESNLRRLEHALRSWEELSGGTITDWETSYNNRIAFRYGVTATTQE